MKCRTGLCVMLLLRCITIGFPLVTASAAEAPINLTPEETRKLEKEDFSKFFATKPPESSSGSNESLIPTKNLEKALEQQQAREAENTKTTIINRGRPITGLPLTENEKPVQPISKATEEEKYDIGDSILSKEQSTMVSAEPDQEAELTTTTTTEKAKAVNGHAFSTQGLSISVREGTVEPMMLDLQTQATTALQLGQVEAAIVLYKQALEKDPNNKYTLFGLGTAYHQQHQYLQARDVYLKAIGKYPEDSRILINYIVLIGELQPEEALVALQNLDRSYSNFSPIAAQIAAIYVKLGDFKQAEAAMRQAIQTAPDNMNYRYNYAVIMDKFDQKREAIMLYDQLLTLARQGKTLPVTIDRLYARMITLRKTLLDEAIKNKGENHGDA